MAQWRLKIDLTFPTMNGEGMEIEFKDFLDITVSRLEGYSDRIYDLLGDAAQNQYDELVSELKFLEDEPIEDTHDFEGEMGALWEFCDKHKIWIEQNWNLFEII